MTGQPTHRRLRRGGFTLIEVAIVIVITAIVAVGVAVFLRAPVAGYVDSAARADLADTADTALRRMARDIRLALPNSVRTANDASNAQYIEFLLTRTGGRYLSTDDNPTSGNVLDFYGGSLKFDVVGTMPSAEQTIQVGDSVVVYNLGQGIVPADAYQTGGQSNRAQIAGISGNTITMATNPYTAQTIKMPSPYYRFQVISGPVTYRCDPNVTHTLTRYWNYTISATQPTSVAAMSTGQNALIATGVSSCAFTYSLTDSMSSALVVLDLQLTSATDANAGTVGLFQQIHVDNTP